MVETEPRLGIMRNARDATEVAKIIKEAMKGIPRNSNLLIGGHPNFILMIAQLSRTLGHRLWLWDDRRQAPYKASFLNRFDKFEIERSLQ